MTRVVSGQVSGKRRRFFSRGTLASALCVFIPALLSAAPQSEGSAEQTSSPCWRKCAGNDAMQEAQMTESSCICPSTTDDDREPQSATLFLGSAIDNFAAGDLRTYLNPSASSDVQTFERLIGGVQFSWRLSRSAMRTKDGTDVRGDRQLWLYGWTVHGVRSSDVTCSEEDKANPNSVCSDVDAGVDPTGRFRYIVRNASSLEAAIGLRWEFLRLDASATGSARLFLSVQESLLTVSGTDGDVAQQNHVGVGVTAPTGQFAESYIEVGYGGSDLFAVHPYQRWKFNGFVTWNLRNSENVRGFARIVVDADFGPGADSVQTYLGIRWNLATLFNWTKGKVNQADDG